MEIDKFQKQGGECSAAVYRAAQTRLNRIEMESSFRLVDQEHLRLRN